METPKRLIAIGDIHGCFISLKILIEDKIKPQKSDKIIFLGDYIDRGSQSKEVIDYILNMQFIGINIITLMGNHESMMMDAFKEDRYIPLWLFNGGDKTLTSFGWPAPTKIPDPYLSFFQNLKYYFHFKNYLFVHAGFNDQILNPFNDTYQMIWTRRDYYTHPVFKEKTIIHGHTPITIEFCTTQIEQNSKVINIDTGCVFKDKPGYGKLTALDVFSKTIYST